MIVQQHYSVLPELSQSYILIDNEFDLNKECQQKVVDRDIAEEQQMTSSAKKMYKSAPKPRYVQPFNPTLYLTRELSQPDILLIKEAFDHHDSNKMGVLTPNDLKQALYNLNFFASKETVYNLIAQCDEEGLGGLTFDAFIRVIAGNPTETETTADLRKLFRKYDRDNKGYIVSGDLLAAAKNLGEPMSEEESRKLFRSLDLKNAGKIQFEDFCLLMHHPNSLN